MPTPLARLGHWVPRPRISSMKRWLYHESDPSRAMSSMRTAFYNDCDPFVARWLHNLMAAEAIPDGVVDERSIVEIREADFKGFPHCHWFAGIAGWARALQLAGWPMDRPVWTASVPCQPFSDAGQRHAEHDERHLWPTLAALIDACRPPVIFGEQVEGAISLGWLDGICDDLVSMRYSVGAAVLPAAAVGAPHLRHRIYWVAMPDDEMPDMPINMFGEPAPLMQQPAPWVDEHLRALRHALPSTMPRPSTNDLVLVAPKSEASAGALFTGQGETDGMHLPMEAGGDSDGEARLDITGHQPHCCVADPHGGHACTEGLQRGGEHGLVTAHGGPHHWCDAQLVRCSDGAHRRVGSRVQCVADGLPDDMGGLRSEDQGRTDPCDLIWPIGPTTPARISRLRGYGNSVVPQLASIFIKTVLARMQ